MHMPQKPNSSKTFISVIVQEPDQINLRFHEAFIFKLQPTINSSAELNKLNQLLFWNIVFSFVATQFVLSEFYNDIQIYYLCYGRWR